MDEMFCYQCEQAANCTACTGKAGVCGKSADTAAAQDRLTGALISYAGQLIGEGHPGPGTGPFADAGAIHHHY